jgi:hypothetical protein
MPGLTKRIKKIIDMEGGTKELETNNPTHTVSEESKTVSENKKNLDEALPKLIKSLPKGIAMSIAPKLIGIYFKAVNRWLENKQGVLGINFSDPNATVSEQAPKLAKAFLDEARGWVKTVNEPEFEEAVEIITELVRDLIKKEVSPLVDDLVETAMPKLKNLADEQVEILEKKGAKLGRTFADIGSDSLEVAFPPMKVVNAASNVIANFLTAIDVGGKVTLSGLEQAADIQTEMMGKESGGPLMTMARTYKKVKTAKDEFAEKIHNLASKLESGQMLGNAPSIQNMPTVPQPTVPQPTVPKPTVPQPTVPKPTVPKPTVPKNTPTVGGKRKTKRRRKKKRKKKTKKRALKKRH